jgi:L-alanine-DL-glutamate epimerase-like enolase superfamily enzyme
MRHLSLSVERFPIAGAFVISRGSRTEAVVVVATLREGDHAGRGESVPYARYGETIEGVMAALESMTDPIRQGLDRAGLMAAMPAGAARNALDAALWALEARQTGRRVWDLAGVAAPRPLTTCYTLSLGAPDSMEQAARAAADRPLLKVKLGGEGDPARIAAVRRGAPASRLVVDANEAWRPDTWHANLAACVEAGVELIEQPFPANADEALATLARPIPICADESFHGIEGLARLRERYDAVNLKLDKTGGLTAALEVRAAARAAGFGLMVGCMLGTSLGMAPALLLADGADFVDLDGPLLLAQDRPDGLTYVESTVHPFGPELWG